MDFQDLDQSTQIEISGGDFVACNAGMVTLAIGAGLAVGLTYDGI